ncbi:MAG TPA: acyl-CoA dehydrogenase family protein [Actinocrinis sp.]|nr:acyl-CoA dehydrogenase family protein [Actinocrinis sp.]
MDLRPDPIQTRLAQAVDAALTRTGSLSAELAAIGIPALGAPERLGGLGLGLGADVIVNTRLGFALQPLAEYRETALALELLTAEDVAPDVLADIFKGLRHATTVGAHTEPLLRVGPEGLLRGESEPLAAGDFALAVVRATADDGVARWFTVPSDVLADPAQTSARTIELLGVPHIRLRLSGARAVPLELPGDRLAKAMDGARMRQAALLLGLADRMFEVARGHVNRRVQYDRPLVELQTVSHRLARLVGEADGWRMALHEATWTYDRGETRGVEVGAAGLLAAAAEHAQSATRTALQLHGVRGMLAHSTAAAAYRIASVESARLGTAGSLWAVEGERLARSSR